MDIYNNYPCVTDTIYMWCGVCIYMWARIDIRVVLFGSTFNQYIIECEMPKLFIIPQNFILAIQFKINTRL